MEKMGKKPRRNGTFSGQKKNPLNEKKKKKNYQEMRLEGTSRHSAKRKFQGNHLFKVRIGGEKGQEEEEPQAFDKVQ